VLFAVAELLVLFIIVFSLFLLLRFAAHAAQTCCASRLYCGDNCSKDAACRDGAVNKSEWL